MSKNPACQNCGGFEYTLESGFYFCLECNVQSQEIVEQVYDFYAGQSVVTARRLQDTTVKEPTIVNETIINAKVLTSWETLNYVLIGLVNELILLGASRKLKRTALKLWAAYLMKLEVAFTSRNLIKKPRLGVVFRRKDAELLYGASEELTQAHKKPIYAPRKRRRLKSSVKTSDTSRTSVSSRRQSFMSSMKRRKLAKAEYLETSSQATQSTQLTLQTLSDRTLSQSGSQKSNKLKYTKHAKRSFLSLLEKAKSLDESERRSLQSSLMIKESDSLRHVNMMQIVAIIRLALILLNEDIHTADILRWSDSGHISLGNAEKLLPTDVKIEKDVKALFKGTLTSRHHIQRNVSRLAKFLGLNKLKINLKYTIERYCYELCLPVQVSDIIDKLFLVHSADCSITMYTNYEARAMALIIFVLKLLFGLDGVTERTLSTLAVRLKENEDCNNFIPFNWMEWVKFINARNAICSYHVSSIRDKYYPNSRVGGPDNFLSQWDNTPHRQILERYHVIENTIKDALKRTIQSLLSDTSEPFPPSKSPLSLSLNIILSDKYCNISPKVRSLLETDFQEHSVDYLISPEIINKIKTTINCQIKKTLGCEHRKEKSRFQRPWRIGPKSKSKKVHKEVTLQFIDDDYQELDNSIILDDDSSSINDECVELTDKKKHKHEVYYFPGQYWVYQGISRLTAISVEDFEDVAAKVFPESFYWLLKECAKIIGQSIRDVYHELIFVQRLYIK